MNHVILTIFEDAPKSPSPRRRGQGGDAGRGGNKRNLRLANQSHINPKRKRKNWRRTHRKVRLRKLQKPPMTK